MSFKSHLLIICFISIAVITAWKVMNNSKNSEPVAKIIVVSDHQITVTHASWGLECVNIGTPHKPDEAYVRKIEELPIKRDNVLERIALQCNGHTSCIIGWDEATLGPDPSPDCGKTLEIEYRCFSYDTPRIIKSTSDPIALQCENASHQAPQP